MSRLTSRGRSNAKSCQFLTDGSSARADYLYTFPSAQLSTRTHPLRAQTSSPSSQSELSLAVDVTVTGSLTTCAQSVTATVRHPLRDWRSRWSPPILSTPRSFPTREQNYPGSASRALRWVAPRCKPAQRCSSLLILLQSRLWNLFTRFRPRIRPLHHSQMSHRRFALPRARRRL